jgi:SPP1 family predicted phage head-tail adaptor
MTTIGRLRHRVTLEAPDETPDGAGGVARAWTPLGEVWAAIEPLGAGEAVIADKRLGRLSHRIFIRHRAGLTLNHRLRLGARTFSIRSLRDAEERGRFLECLVEEERP